MDGWTAHKRTNGGVHKQRVHKCTNSGVRKHGVHKRAKNGVRKERKHKSTSEQRNPLGAEADMEQTLLYELIFPSVGLPGPLAANTSAMLLHSAVCSPQCSAVCSVQCAVCSVQSAV